MFVDQPESIIIRAVATDADGWEVPVSGVWRYATDFSRIGQLTGESPSIASGEFRGDEPGEASIIIEFIPAQPEAPTVRAATSVRALDWDIVLSTASGRTTTGSDEVGLVAVITDHRGQPVTDPAAQVIFLVDHSSKVAGERKEKPRVGRYQDDGRALAVNPAGVPVTAGIPDANGQVRGSLLASTIPGDNMVTAVLQFHDLVVPGAPPLEADRSASVRVEVEPGPAAYIGWEPDRMLIEPGQVYRAEINAYDAFGNITGDTGPLRVSIQSPVGGHVDFSVDRGKSWIMDYRWYQVSLGTQVQLRCTAEAWRQLAGRVRLLDSQD